MRQSLTAVAIAALAGTLAVPALAATRTVKVGDNYFVRDGAPPTVVVRKGTTVRWSWVGGAPHNVTVVSGPVRFRSPIKTRGTYTKRVTKAGTYKIVCTIHSGMSMRLRVR